MNSAATRLDRRGWLRLVNRLFLVIALAGITIAIVTHAGEIEEQLVQLSLAPLVLACIVVAAAQIGMALSSAFVLIQLGSKARPTRIARAILASLLGKYLPGKIAVGVMRATALLEQGVPLRLTLGAFVLEQLYVLTTAGLIGLALIVGTAPTRLTAYAVLVASSLAALAFISRIAARIPRLSALRDSQLSPAKSLLATGGYLVSWLAIGAGVVLAAIAFGVSVDLATSVRLVSAYVLAVVAGFVAVFAPGGIGVREAVFLAAAQPAVGAEAALVIAVTARIVLTVGEALAVAAMFVVDRLLTGSSEQPS